MAVTGEDRCQVGLTGEVLVLVSPGQGAQTPGYLSPWIGLPRAAQIVTAASTTCGLDLADLGSNADADTIRDTAVAQPLLVASAVASAIELLEGMPAPDLVAGHSVGEIAAAIIAGVLDVDAGMRFVTTRARGMAAASAVQPTSMTAVVGGERDDVLAAIADAGLTAANDNGSGQIVAAGTVEQLASLVAPRRARLFSLSVAGAFHTEHMRPAVAELAAVADTLSPADPQLPLLSNADGHVVSSGQDYLHRLVDQVCLPVRWDLCMATMAERGVTGLLELSPAGTLTGIAKRNLAGVELFSLTSPEQLPEARDFVSRHAGAR